MEEAAKADDAAALVALLRPEDRPRYRLSTVEKGRQELIGNLYLSTRGPDSAAFKALVKHGIHPDAGNLTRLPDFTYFKENFPDFTTTLGSACVTYACENGVETMLMKLIDVGVPPKPSDLATAVRRNRAGIVSQLIKRGVPASETIDADGKKLTVEAFARKAMRFQVLDALGVGPRYETELKPFRQGRPGKGATRFLGDWTFNSEKLHLDLQADGTGTLGVGFPAYDGEPVLWSMEDKENDSTLRVVPVPGYTDKPLLGEIQLSTQAGGLTLVRSGKRIAGIHRGMDEAQQRAAIAVGGAFAGPTGSWELQIPKTASPQEKEMMKGTTIEIAADGTVLLRGPQKVTGKLQGGEANELFQLFIGELPPRQSDFLGKQFKADCDYT